MKIDGGVPLDRYQKLISELPRRRASLFMQLRTGHAPLNKHLHCIRSAGLSIYPACANSEEMVRHIVMICPARRTQRDALPRSIPNRAYHIRRLLSSDNISRVHRSHQKTRTCIWKHHCRRLKGSETTRSPRTLRYSHLRKPYVPARTPRPR
jgi:hypothetical protein